MKNYTLIPAKTQLIQWTPLWHIIVVSVAAGCGLALAFGLILLGIEYFETGKTPALKGGGAVLGVAAAAVCVLGIAAGVYAMCNPQSSKPLKVVPKTAQVANHRAPA